MDFELITLADISKVLLLNYLLGVLALLIAIVLDWMLGEPRRFHPLIGFGYIARRLEFYLNRYNDCSATGLRWLGIVALLLALLPPLLIISLLLFSTDSVIITLCIEIVVIYLALGHRSLYEHAYPIYRALQQGDSESARELTSMMVSRDTATLNIHKAATESVLENGNDAVFATLFWFMLAGVPGVIIHRLVNTLDAMWGYRTVEYRHFGWAAARLDDVLNYFPARLTALTYALLGKTRVALHCWHQQARHWDSPNAGPVMAAGAGALGVSLGGRACYQGQWHERHVLGIGNAPNNQTILQSLNLVHHGVLLWLVVYLTVSVIAHV